MAKAVFPNPDGTLVDIGGGTGVITAQFAKGFGEIHIVEPSRRKRKHGQKQRPALRFHDARAEKLPFKADAVDCLTAVVSFHHMTDHAAAAREAYRVLRPGGRFVVFEFHPRQGYGRWRSPDMVAGHMHFMEPEQLVAILRDANFRCDGAVEIDEGYIVTATK